MGSRRGARVGGSGGVGSSAATGGAAAEIAATGKFVGKQLLSYYSTMPTVLRSGPYRFYFYAGDQDEPPHVHVERDNCEAKLWLYPVRLQWSSGFPAKEISRVEKLVLEHQQEFLERWNEFFNG